MKKLQILLATVLFTFSLNLFSQDSIKITAPSAESVVTSGKDFVIKWELRSLNAVSNKTDVKIELLQEGKAPVLISDTTTNSVKLDHTWKVNADTSDNYQIKITDIKDTNLFGLSGKFKISKVKEEDSFRKEIERIESVFIKKKLSIDYDSSNIQNENLRVLSRNLDSLQILKSFDKMKDYDEKRKIDTLNSYIRSLDKLITEINSGRKFYILGDAGVIKSVTDSGKISGNGSLGLKYVSADKRLVITVLMLIASSNEVLKASYNDSGKIKNISDFGASILTPTLGNRAVKSGLAEFIFYPESDESRINYRFGFRATLNIAAQTWADTIKQSQVSIVALDIGLIYDVIPLSIREKKNFALRFNLSLINRNLWGDIYNESNFQNKLIGETKKGFFGVKAGFEIELYGVTASMQYPIIFNSTLKGLSKGQLVGGFNVSAGIPLN